MHALLLALLMASLCGAASASPFAQLRLAYGLRDAQLGATAYAVRARMRAGEPGRQQPWLKGRAAIERQFATWFNDWASAASVDLNFRASGPNSGWYRVAVDGQQACGRYRVQLTHEAGHWRFASDHGEPVDCALFHAAPGPLMFDDTDTPLDANFHDPLLGRFLGIDGCVWRITRSAWRLQWEDGCRGERLGLQRRSGWHWVDTQGQPLRFEPGAKALVWRGHRALRMALAEQAEQALPLRTDDGLLLRASLRRPLGAGPWPGVVLLHGSGPQDRHGYAGLLRRLGDELVEAGVAVLSYDKRGSEARAGESASFERLGDDARTALAALRAQPGVDAARTALAGSSQAGWVAAQVLAKGAERPDWAAPAAVLLLMAAGSAVDVPSQVLHHTAQQLRCRGEPPDAVLAQQRAFFAVRRDPVQQPKLDQANRALPVAQRVWALPGADDGPTSWHRVLELDFDPLPHWQQYRGGLTVLLAEHDEASPTRAIEVALRAQVPGARVLRLEGANHLGLLADSPCTPMTDGRRWHPALWPAVRDWVHSRLRTAAPATTP